jgi:hypothetical protein
LDIIVLPLLIKQNLLTRIALNKTKNDFLRISQKYLVYLYPTYQIGVSKKTEKSRKLEKKKLKKPNREKKPIKILKKPIGSISVL